MYKSQFVSFYLQFPSSLAVFSPSHLLTFFSFKYMSPTHEGVKPPVKRWALAASAFGTVRAQLGCSISVRPLDLHEVGLDHLRVHYDDQSKELLISAEGVKSSVSISLTAPIKSNLFITTQGKGHVQVENMECDICTVQTEQGSCFLHCQGGGNGHRVEVQSHGGHVTGVGTIHGNVDISTRGDGAVNVKKLQGNKMNISTERGPLKVKAIYAESSCISSCSGRIELGNVHGEQTAASMLFNMSGDTVSSHSGAIDVHVGDGGSAQLHSQEGKPACFSVFIAHSSVMCRSGVRARPLLVESRDAAVWNVGYINGKPQADQCVRVRADRNSVRLKTQSWFESLKLVS
uniref:Family with sequence similarity 185 member A n=1 Tax=Gasterosteus aculeatus aculeatus TaxID=481459 RepID=A0AAQ4RS55_GASAC